MTHVARWHEFTSEQTDIPAGMTVRDWRPERACTRPTSRRADHRRAAAEGRAATRHGRGRAMRRLSPVPRRATKQPPQGVPAC